MDTLVLALGPAFVIALGIQQVTEALRSLLGWVGSSPDEPTDADKAKLHFVVLVVAFGVGLAAALAYPDVRILTAFRPNSPPADWLDVVATGLVVSGGTEGLNSFLKFLGYTKEKKEEEAKAQEAEAQAFTAQKALMEAQVRTLAQ